MSDYSFDPQDNYSFEFEENPEGIENLETELEENDADGYETSPTDDPQESTPRRSGLSLDLLYEHWKAEPTEESMARLLEDVRDFSVRLVLKKNPTNSEAQDISQMVALKVWNEITKKDFIVTHRFTSFVSRVVTNTLIDQIRYTTRKGEVELQDWAAYSTGGVSRSVPVGDSTDTEEFPSCGKQPLLTKSEQNAAENGLNTQLDLDKRIQNLSAREQKVLDLIRFGFSTEQIAKELNLTVKQVYNGKQQLRLKIKAALVVDYAVLVHTCRLQFDVFSIRKEDKLTELPAGRYIRVGNGAYRRLADVCRCKKVITRKETEELSDCGEVQQVVVVSGGKAAESTTMVWAAQSVRMPRVGRTGQPQMERFAEGSRRDLDDIEVGHQMDVAALRALIAPFRKDGWGEGRPVFTSFHDEQTSGGHTIVGSPESPRLTDPATVITSVDHCVCGKPHLEVALYKDGSTRHNGKCGYLAVFRARKPVKRANVIIFNETFSKAPSSSVFSIEGQPSGAVNAV